MRHLPACDTVIQPHLVAGPSTLLLYTAVCNGFIMTELLDMVASCWWFAELWSHPCRQYSGASSLPEVVPSSSWEIKPEDISIAKHSDGSDWEIGSGGFGKAGFETWNARAGKT